MRQLKVTIKGAAPLLMHSDRHANPLDPSTKAHKELTGKRKKTDSDHEAIARSEWMGSLYCNAAGPFVPGQNIDAALIQAAKLQKLGKRFAQAVMVVENEVPLDYQGPRDAEKLFADPRFIDVRGVRVGMAKLMRCRPKFLDWAATFTVAFNEDVVNVNDVRRALEDAGALVGLCDYRPRFGKFTVETVQ
jgi:hypothetical protein